MPLANAMTRCWLPKHADPTWHVQDSVCAVLLENHTRPEQPTTTHRKHTTTTTTPPIRACWVSPWSTSSLASSPQLTTHHPLAWTPHARCSGPLCTSQPWVSFQVCVFLYVVSSSLLLFSCLCSCASQPGLTMQCGIPGALQRFTQQHCKTQTLYVLYCMTCHRRWWHQAVCEQLWRRPVP